MSKPTETQCPVCKLTFLQPNRKQGGGKRTIYCSAKCRSKDWARGNGAKRKAAILKYDNKLESKEKKKERSRKAKLKKYGISEETFIVQLERQNFSCYGCLNEIDTYSARIDHDHVTGAFRGLLCDSCNWSLGHAKDDPAVLRRLMAYLDYQINKTNIYITGGLKNPRIPEIGNKLRVLGFDVMDEWFTPGAEADLNWKKYEDARGRPYHEALRGRSATNIFLFDKSYLDHSDIVIMVMPAGKSASLELGYAKGRNKKTIIFLDGQEPDRPDMMANFADAICATEEELINELRK